MASGNGVTCSRCSVSGLGWCISRSSRRHYLAWLVPTPIVRDGQIVNEMRPQGNLLHKCGQTLEQSRQAAAEYAAERAKIRALGQAPQPIAPATPAQAPAKGKGKAVKAPAAKVSTAATVPQAQALPFVPEPVKMAPVVGKLEAQVITTRALVAKGFPEALAQNLATTATPAQLAALLLT